LVGEMDTNAVHIHPRFSNTVRELMFGMVETEFLTLFRLTETARRNREKKVISC
jgi:hypothetical protein